MTPSRSLSLLALLALAGCGDGQSPEAAAPVSRLLDAQASDPATKVVVVKDDSQGGHNTVKYPVLLTGDGPKPKAYRMACTNEEAAAAVGAATYEDNGELFDSQRMLDGDLGANPVIKCHGGPTYASLLRYPVPDQGSRYFVKFTGDATGTTYELGCANLMNAMDLPAASAATVNDLPAGQLRSLNCVKGDVVAAHTFYYWCTDQVQEGTAATRATVKAIKARIAPVIGSNDCRNIEKHLLTKVGLDLSGAGISDVMPLTTLAHLRYLSLGDNAIIDVAPLAALKSLVWVDLHANPALGDLKELGTLPALDHLDLSHTGAKDLDKLSRLGLRSLAVDGNGLTKLNDVTPFKHLVVLSANDQQIDSLAPVASLRELQTLAVERNRIPDLDAIPTAGAVRKLYVSGNGVTTLEPLAEQNLLELLAARDNPIAKNTTACPTASVTPAPLRAFCTAWLQ